MMSGAGVGLLVGVVLASALDAALLGWEKNESPATPNANATSATPHVFQVGGVF
jgi:hypothetical protein